MSVGSSGLRKVMPPSATSTWPVTQSSSTSATIALAMSFAVARELVGGREHRRVGAPRRDRVDADAVMPQLRRGHAHELVHGRLGRGVVDDAAIADDPRDRTGGDDRAGLARRDHGPRRFAQAQEHTADVHPLHAVPFVRAHLQNRAHATDARREHGDARWTELVYDSLHGGDDRAAARRRRADAARPAGDEGDGSVQLHAVTLTSRRVD